MVRLAICVVAASVIGMYATFTNAQDFVPRDEFDKVVDRLERRESEFDRVVTDFSEALERLERTEAELRRLNEGVEELTRLPATQVSHLGGYDSMVEGRLCELESELCYLWNTQTVWQPYVEANFRGGGIHERGELDLFVPLVWSDRSLLFADLRGSVGDTEHHEGNWALAARTLTCSNWILGGWASYDLRETQFGNHFDQISFGLEAMDLDWDLRVAGYVPTNLDAQQVAAPTAVISGNNIVVRRNEERPYWGVDGEIGRLLWFNDPCCACDGGWMSSLDAELRAFIGGYYFDNPAAGFDEIAGPRARVELRLYDLPILGDGSRLTIEGLAQHDNVRDTQVEAAIFVRIPFGHRPGNRLSPMQRRMVDRIVRDVDVVVDDQIADEAAKIARTGEAITSVRVVDASDDLSAEVAAAGAHSVVVVDGSAGIISEPDTTVLNTGQVVMGGGAKLDVVGCDTGTAAQFCAPGTRPQVHGTDVFTDVFTIADSSTLTGLDITGGRDGVFGTSVTGFMLMDLNISGAADDGVNLGGSNSGDILGVVSSLNVAYGFEIDIFTGGSVSGNTASGNGFIGLGLGFLNGGSVSGNTASGNGADGFFGTLTGGSFSGNTASANGFNGFNIAGGQSGGSFSGNTASGNGSNGFRILTLIGGSVSGNTASGNGADGFDIGGFTGGMFDFNSATMNGDRGYEVTGAAAPATATGNTGGGNTGGGNTFTFP